MPNYAYWLNNARKYLGTKEIPGPHHSNVIKGWLKKLNAWWSDDETPWCGVFVAAVMQESGLSFPKAYYRAKEWAFYGSAVNGPALGAIAVLQRPGGGHVGFVTGVTSNGSHVRLLGGNQNNMVNEAWFDTLRVVAYRKPNLTVVDAAPVAKLGELSKSEA